MADITRWDPFGDINLFRSTMDRIFDELTPFRMAGPTREYEMSAPIDLYETNDEIVVKSLLPGVKPGDIDIAVVGNLLTLRGNVREDREDKGQNYYRREVRSGQIMRQITLPTEVVSEKAEATFEDGVLRLRLPKAETVKPKAIKVQAKPTIEGKGAPQVQAGEKSQSTR